MFGIELENAIRKLNRMEAQELKIWVISEYGTKYPDTIDRVFNRQAVRIRLGL